MRTPVPIYTRATDPELQDEIIDLAQLPTRTPDHNRIPPNHILAEMLDEIRTRTQIGGAACAR